MEEYQTTKGRLAEAIEQGAKDVNRRKLQTKILTLLSDEFGPEDPVSQQMYHHLAFQWAAVDKNLPLARTHMRKALAARLTCEGEHKGMKQWKEWSLKPEDFLKTEMGIDMDLEESSTSEETYEEPEPMPARPAPRARARGKVGNKGRGKFRHGSKGYSRGRRRVRGGRCDCGDPNCPGYYPVSPMDLMMESMMCGAGPEEMYESAPEECVCM
ncbi:hypothetical protein KIPB_009234 [Kipferlia bialata]|uniref:Uncharacterized protein n=1 Tax=Kipferlia bialata TaxID=797122 RepID=A0A9K3D415_9EUKA|nr:hypothetical protein KIPB_009234 [Kipferlia bialata]|eukprot:g9234.t1